MWKWKYLTLASSITMYKLELTVWIAVGMLCYRCLSFYIALDHVCDEYYYWNNQRVPNINILSRPTLFITTLYIVGNCPCTVYTVKSHYNIYIIYNIYLYIYIYIIYVCKLNLFIHVYAWFMCVCKDLDILLPYIPLLPSSAFIDAFITPDTHTHQPNIVKQ